MESDTSRSYGSVSKQGSELGPWAREVGERSYRQQIMRQREWKLTARPPGQLGTELGQRLGQDRAAELLGPPLVSQAGRGGLSADSLYNGRMKGGNRHGL